MLDLAAAREVISREVNTMVRRLNAASDPDWDRPTRCASWKVRDLARHIAFGQAFEADALRRMRDGVSEPAQASTPDPSSSRPIIMAAIDHGHRELAQALAELTPEKLDGMCPLGYATLPGAFALNFFAFEAGVHGNDLAWALGDECPLPPDIMRATILVLGAAFPMFAQHASRKPAGEIGYQLRGTSVNFRLLYRGGSWHQEGELPTRACSIAGDDSSLLLFALGRIPFDHPSLTIRGERDFARDFKIFFPGP